MNFPLYAKWIEHPMAFQLVLEQLVIMLFVSFMKITYTKTSYDVCAYSGTLLIYLRKIMHEYESLNVNDKFNGNY